MRYPLSTPSRAFPFPTRQFAGRHSEVDHGGAGIGRFRPNVFLTLAYRPAKFRAFFTNHDEPMLKATGSFTKAGR
ncbi:MAG: Alkyl hydroperoxide reductase AhpD [Herminiimonas sp.]|nr:Alkyl hydroperoxide reductase AhpD [Herminiimonas sp.]MDB5853912.1 Alkyl hydroperoxide reductase AhpD [Herminiimonas sp.]